MSFGKGVVNTIRLFFCGLFMGIAEIIPGISGGTVAFVLGIYQPFLDSIKSLNMEAFKLLFKGQFKAFFEKLSWRFLLPLFLGSAVAFIALAKVFAFMLGHEVYRVYLFALFMGLILASTIYCGRRVRPWSLRHIALFLLCAALSFAFTGGGMSTRSSNESFAVHIPQDKVTTANRVDNYDLDREMLGGVSAATLNAMIAKRIITHDTKVYHYASDRYGLAGEFADGHFKPGVDFYLIFCGMVSISAMLLPGVSGSYLMTVLGAYPTVIGALADFIEGAKSLTLNVEAAWVILSVSIGIIIGALTFARVVSWLMSRYAGITIAALTGFMVGSMRCLWPFWSYGYHLQPLRIDHGPQLQVVSPIMPDTGSPIFFVATALVVVGFVCIISFEFFNTEKDN